MTVDEIVQNPLLKTVLDVGTQTRQHCTHLVDLLEANDSREIQEGNVQPDFRKLQNILRAHLSQLRGLNREAVHGVRSTKQNTAEARQEIDRLHLQLQNLYYEERHLRGEIAACESYEYVQSYADHEFRGYADRAHPSHKYQQLPMIPVEEFLQFSPDHMGDNEKSLMIARINHEHAERETLEQARQELLKTKRALIADNKKRKDDLASLDKDLEIFIDAAKPIQELFEKQY